MPFYDLRCSNCEKEFNIRVTMEEKTKRRIPCPECGSTDMKTVYKSAPFYIKSGGNAVQECPSSSTCGNACPYSKGA